MNDVLPSTTITHLPSPEDSIVIRAEFPALSPRVLFDYWTQQDLITQWWPQEAQIDPRKVATTTSSGQP
ncbi:MAG: hypothetical protein NVSMB52_07480 [Chloroflexota bacterium]